VPSVMRTPRPSSARTPYASSTSDRTSRTVIHHGEREVVAGADDVSTRHDNLSVLPYLATLLDAAIVIAASAAIVVLLGGRTRFLVEGVRVSLRTAGPLAEIAGALLLVRVVAFRFVRALPAFAPATMPFEQERSHLLRASPLTRRVMWYAA